MIADFPDIKKFLHKQLNDFLKQNVKSWAPLSTLARRKRMHEWNRMSVQQEGEGPRINEIKKIESKLTISDEEMVDMWPEAFLWKISSVANDMASQMEQHALTMINEAVSEVWNVLEGNPEISTDVILRGLEMIYIDFENDDRSKPVMPTIFLGHEAWEKLFSDYAKLSDDKKKTFESENEKILDKKYREYMEDVASRKIID